MSTLISVLAALLLLSIIVTFHEAGHYFAGKKLGFTIQEFSVGMGPAIIKGKRNGTVFSLRAFPIGGACMFQGEDQEATDGATFNSQPAWKRFIVILSGPMMNVLLAFLLSAIAVLAFGTSVPSIFDVTEGKPAYEAGVLPGDILLEMDGASVGTIEDCSAAIQAADSSNFSILVERNGEQVLLVLPDIMDPATGNKLLGITMGYTKVRLGFAHSLQKSVENVWDVVHSTFSFFGVLFRGEAKSTDVSGPVGTVAIISSVLSYGLEMVLNLGMLINISLAIMNLLPLPALDGGRLLFILIEWIMGKPVPREKEGMVHFIGIVLLLGLMVFLTFNDIRNLLGGVI